MSRETEDPWVLRTRLRGGRGLTPSSKETSKINSKETPKQISRNPSPIESPNKFEALADDKDQEGRECRICEKSLSILDDKLIDCQRCKEYYCIKCLGKSEEEHKILANSDVMWFCGPCRGKVEKNIIQDRELEEKCQDIMRSFEARISSIETAVAEKCSKEETKKMINEELDKRFATSTVDGATTTEPQPAKPANSNVGEVLQEINRRKERENNIIIYGLEESNAKTKPERIEHDHKKLQEVLDVLEVEIKREDIEVVARCGKFDKEKFLKDKARRPVRVVIKKGEKKTQIFKSIKKLRENESMKDVSISNDLTLAERKQEKLMYEQAQELTRLSSGEFSYRVRGPPWARKITKVPKAPVDPEAEPPVTA